MTKSQISQPKKNRAGLYDLLLIGVLLVAAYFLIRGPVMLIARI